MVRERTCSRVERCCGRAWSWRQFLAVSSFMASKIHCCSRHAISRWFIAIRESIVIAHNGKNGTSRGQFDVIIIAHNGKCANRLLSASGLPLVAKQMKNFDLSSIWALLAAFDDPLPTVNFEGAFVKGVESLSWMGNNSAKLGNSRTPQTISEFFCFCNISI